jgi:hypothetical protein
MHHNTVKSPIMFCIWPAKLLMMMYSDTCTALPELHERRAQFHTEIMIRATSALHGPHGVHQPNEQQTQLTRLACKMKTCFDRLT